ncbi:MAG TPA: phosphate ABC transporter substrate-binding protein PstS, partial [Candidatus Binatus sp.]|nr:phosphate ABC transporter substrate-binding protein PstS [Candidatus Binatus sp.]
MPNLRLVLIGLGAIMLVVAGIYGSYVLASPQDQAANLPSVTINGAGATLAYPLLSLISGKYTQNHPNIQINYQPIGSVGGIKQFTVKTIDFGATYPPMTAKQRVAAPGALHIPEAISALASAYNLPTVHQRINLNGDVLAQIYLGRVSYWNDTAIADLNPGVTLPPAYINTIHQEDGDGTTFVFTEFLSHANGEWRSNVGFGTLVSFPVGLGVPTSAGVASLVSTTPTSIGYMELSYALQS